MQGLQQLAVVFSNQPNISYHREEKHCGSPNIVIIGNCCIFGCMGCLSRSDRSVGGVPESFDIVTFGSLADAPCLIDGDARPGSLTGD